MIFALIHERCFAELPGETKLLGFTKSTSAKAAMHGQELRGLTFHDN